MRHLEPLEFSVEEIVKNCASSFRNETLKKKFSDSAGFIAEKSSDYKKIAEDNYWEKIPTHETVNKIISKDEMVKLYNQKFVRQPDIREKYYDKILSNAKFGKCPICGIGQASTLDHYLAKTLYPTYAVTPDNLTPACKDCNSAKRNKPIECEENAPFHPYFEDIDGLVWLCADLILKGKILIAKYHVNHDVDDKDFRLYRRLRGHLSLYKLQHMYSVQASTEISENIEMWKKIYLQSGKNGLVQYFSECLSSCEIVQKNTWKTALLRGLINSVNDDMFESLTK